MRKTAYLLASLIPLTLTSAAEARDPSVKIEAGKIEGTASSRVRAFLGVPYASAPVGDLRWRAPQPVKPWSGSRTAKHFSPSCTQDEPKPFGPYTAAFLNPPETSEDCLYLNVWASAKGASKQPVYFFIHGGAYQAGSSNVSSTYGEELAQKGVVVVTINYRLGMLGFFAHPELSKESPLGTSGNYGVLDAIEALRWVRTNIARFGGDPANVTIAGQSAGAGMVNALLTSPLAKGLFHRAVLESGPTIGIPMLSLSAAESTGKASVAKAKAGNIAGLRAIPAADLKRVALAGLPIPIVDGKVIPENPEAPTTKLVSRVPIIIGYTRDETAPEEAPKTAKAFISEVRSRFGKLAEQALSLYPHATDAEAARSGVQIVRDRRVAGLLLWAEQRRTEGVPVYAYHFEHVLPGSDPARFGAFHSSEIPYVFGVMRIPGVNFTDEDRDVSQAMQERWLAFMRTGNPAPPGASVRWMRSTLDPATIWRIDPADAAPLLDAARLALFRDHRAAGGRLGLL